MWLILVFKSLIIANEFEFSFLYNTALNIAIFNIGYKLYAVVDNFS